MRTYGNARRLSRVSGPVRQITRLPDPRFRGKLPELTDFADNLPFPHWDRVYFLVLGTPPPPLILQNLENTGFILRLCARSLSLQELQAKSREHRSYGLGGGRAVPFWNRIGLCPGHRRAVGSAVFAPGMLQAGSAFRVWPRPNRVTARIRLSKIDDYPVDNVSWSRLSSSRASVNEKA